MRCKWSTPNDVNDLDRAAATRPSFFWSLTLSQTHAGPTAVLIDKLDAGGF
jgi:hypothetical protein